MYEINLKNQEKITREKNYIKNKKTQIKNELKKRKNEKKTRSAGAALGASASRRQPVSVAPPPATGPQRLPRRRPAARRLRASRRPRCRPAAGSPLLPQPAPPGSAPPVAAPPGCIWSRGMGRGPGERGRKGRSGARDPDVGKGQRRRSIGPTCDGDEKKSTAHCKTYY